MSLALYPLCHAEDGPDANMGQRTEKFSLAKNSTRSLTNESVGDIQDVTIMFCSLVENTTGCINNESTIHTVVKGLLTLNVMR